MRMRCCVLPMSTISLVFFFFNDTATTEIYTLSLHDALPIWRGCVRLAPAREGLSAVGGGHPHRVQPVRGRAHARSEEHTSELQSQSNLVCRLLLEKKKKKKTQKQTTTNSPSKTTILNS